MLELSLMLMLMLMLMLGHGGPRTAASVSRRPNLHATGATALQGTRTGDAAAHLY